jgi:hypothetical protein
VFARQRACRQIGGKIEKERVREKESRKTHYLLLGEAEKYPF